MANLQVRDILPMAADDFRRAPIGQRPQPTFPLAGAPASLIAMRTNWIDFYDSEYHAVVRFVMRTGACLDDARDAASEAFVESWELMTRHPDRWSQIGNQRSWIRTVALRKQQRSPGPRRRPMVDTSAAIPDLPDPSLEPGELTAQTQAVLHALRVLDEPEQAVMAFRLDHFPVAVIADTLGITEQQVRDVTRKARTKLKRALATAKTPERRTPA